MPSSLSALGNVINALTDAKSTHVPYRDSKLTRVLQEAIGGNSRTTLIVCASEAASNEAETVSTLRFGTRAKSIKNKAVVNVERSPAQLRALLERAERRVSRLSQYVTALESELSAYRCGETPKATAKLSDDELSPAETPKQRLQRSDSARAGVPDDALRARLAELESSLADA